MNDAFSNVLAVALLLFGGALLWLSVHGLLQRSGWSDALGTVVSHHAVGEPQSTARNIIRYPVDVGIEFRDKDGRTIRFTEKIDAFDIIPGYNIGAVVAVRYRPENPATTADSQASSGLGGSILGLMVGLVLVLPVVFYAAIQFGFLGSIHARDPFESTGLILCASVGIAFFLVPALALTIGRVQFLSTAVEAELHVVAIKKEEFVISHHESEPSSAEMSAEAQYTQFELISANRPAMKIAERLPSTQGSPPYAVGEVLRVLYAPQNPLDWIRDRWTSRWLGVVLLAGAGFLLVGIGWLLRPSAKELTDQLALEKAFDKLDSARGDDEIAKASREVFEAAEKDEPVSKPASAKGAFAPEKLSEVVALWNSVKSGRSGALQGGSVDFSKSYSLRATEPVPERWPAQAGDGIVYYVFPTSRAVPQAENQAEPIAQVTVQPGKSAVVRPLAQSLVQLGAVELRALAGIDRSEDVQVALAWIAQKRTFASLNPHARDALKPYYCQRLASGDLVLPKMLRLHHGDFLEWLSCRT